MSGINTTFQQLWAQWPWRPIRNCPGRFVLPWMEESIALEKLLGYACVPQMFSSPQAEDLVLVVALKDGGLISYRQTDGHLIHTLNTPEGFSRKLCQLEFIFPEAHLSVLQNAQTTPPISSSDC